MGRTALLVHFPLVIRVPLEFLRVPGDQRIQSCILIVDSLNDLFFLNNCGEYLSMIYDLLVNLYRKSRRMFQ